MHIAHRLPVLLAPLLLYCGGALAQTRYSLTLVRPFYGPQGMNDLGQIVSFTIPEGPGALPQGAVWTPGSPPSLTLLGTADDAASAINNAGQLAGSHRIAPNLEHAAIFENGGFRDLGTLGGRSSNGAAINESGQVAGSAAVASNLQHAFLYTGGAMRDLGTLAGGWSYAYGLNDRGDVVGAATIAPGHDARRHAFVYHDGTMTDLSLFAAEDATALAINNRGQIVGDSRLGGDYRGFLYENGRTSYLGLPGALSSVAQSINDRGEVVGTSTLSWFSAHGFIYTDGRTIDLNTLLDTQDGWTVNQALLINEVGQIAGTACRPYPGGNAFDCATVLMTPVPEPAAPALWAGAALLALAQHARTAWRRHRRMHTLS